jgi:ATP-dependent RNA helicase DHX8/PRP22
MHQVTVIEPKWLSEVAPTFFRVADHNKISKRKQTEKIEPLFDRFATDKDEWVRAKGSSFGSVADCSATE